MAATPCYDLAIIGSGFAGSLLAMIARRLGRSVVLVERGRHPRFAIGESSTPQADLLWAHLARRYGLPRLLPLSQWGSWQRYYPHLPCGLKRGFTFLHHTPGEPFGDSPSGSRAWLVPVSASAEVADTHWYRPEFDQFLVQEARELGAEYLDQTHLEAVRFDPTGATLRGCREGRPVVLRAQWLLDASGPRGFLHRALSLPDAPPSLLPPTQALYSHFREVGRVADWECGQGIAPPPYPPDDAALHHVFDGGWMWVLRFNQGITSAGVALTEPLARELRLAEGAPAWDRLLGRFPTIQRQFAPARAVEPFYHTPRLAFRSGRVAGPGWLLLPHAAGFVDPLLSTGFPLTLLGIQRLARALATAWGTSAFATAVEAYARATVAELQAAERLVAALYRWLHDFPTFRELGRLYFAAAECGERAVRQGDGELPGGFLLHDHPRFGPAAEDCCRIALEGETDPARQSRAARARLAAAVRAAVELIAPPRR